MLSEAVMSLSGTTGKPVTMEVERGAIRKFADAIDDHNPIYWDAEYARGTRFGKIIAPPGFFGWPTRWDTSMPMHSEILQQLIDTVGKAGYPLSVVGGVEFDFFQTVREGDVLTSLSRITEINERESKTGKMVFSTLETTYTSPDGGTVAKVRTHIILR